MKKVAVFLIICCVCNLLFSCGKEGPIGALGPEGPAGEIGATGPAGPAGADGSVIYSGRTTPDLTLGVAGDYYINISTGEFYGPRTETSWGKAFRLKGNDGKDGADGDKGEKGDKGDKGDKGNDGTDGTDGKDGVKGDKGDKGDKGADGKDGTDGIKGDKGDKGEKGDKGADGTKILGGNGVPTASLGAVGDFYLDRQNFVLYGPKLTDNNWGVGLQLQGKDGNANVKSFIIENFMIDGPTFNLEIPAITEQIINTGAVLAYVRTAVDARSHIWNFFPADIQYYIDAYSYTATIRLQYFMSGGLYFVTDPQMWSFLPPLSFRVIVIEGKDGANELILNLKRHPVDFAKIRNLYRLVD